MDGAPAMLGFILVAGALSVFWFCIGLIIGIYIG